MKKLITIMASMATCLLFGDDFTKSGTSFEEYGENAFAPDKDDTGETGETFWYSAGDDTSAFVLSNYAGVASASTPAGVPRPDYFAASNNATFLAIDTSARLYRSAIKNDGDGTFDSVAIPADKGIYLDTLVKFTPAEDVTTLSLEPNADKIAIAYVEHEDETDPTQSYTNFVICAGYLGSPLSVTNYFAAVPADFDKDAWHRLTVRSFASIDAAGDVGFVVYLDQVPLAYDTAVDAGDGFVATGAAAAFYTSELHALFPSAVPADQVGGSAIAAVAFSGNGSVDDVTFTTDTPNFIKAGEQVRTEITLGTGVAAVTVTVGGDTVAPVDAAANPLVFNLPAGTTSFVLGVTADETNGYAFDETTGITLTDATYATADDTVTITGASPALTVVGKRDNAYYMDGETKVGFTTLSEAFANAPVDATIKLGYDYSVADNETTSPTLPVYTINKDLVLDLNGKTLDGGSSNNRFLFKVVNNCTLTVIDSVLGDDGSIVYGGTKGIFDGNNGDINIGSDSDCGPVIIGAVIGSTGYVTEVLRGKFLASVNTTEDDKFVCNSEDYGVDAVPGTCTVTLVGDYWVVEPQGGSEPEVIAVPTAESNLVYDGTEQTGVAAGTGYVLSGTYAATAAGDYTATATLEPGYVWADTTTEAKSINWSIAKAEVVATVSLTVTAATYDSTKTTVTDYTTPSLTFGFGAPELVEDTDYTVAWSATEVSGAGTFTYTVSPVAESNYTFTEASVTLTITEGGSYPSYIPTADAEVQAKYDAWKAAMDAASVVIGDGEAYEDAFLLNCKPDEVTAEKAAFKLDITIVGDTVTVTTPDGKTYNGKVQLKGSNDLSTWTDVESASKSYQFFKAVLAL